MQTSNTVLKFFASLNSRKAKNVFYSLVNCPTYCKYKYVSVTRKIPAFELRKMKLESSHFKSCLTEEVETIKNLFNKNGHEVRIVGGAVRDLLLEIHPTDLDFATTATPQEMKEIFTENEIRMLNKKGEKHGTITVRINERNLEITTLRVDMATDGRHAVVEYTKNWMLDANRRDLTINAMYLGFDGTVYDYFNGIEDLKNRRIAFVGDAADRIKEDYLRILRYFRFYGKVSEVPNNHDEDIMKAIKDNAKGLQTISGERIWIELSKILSGKFSGELLLKIISLNIGPYIGFPENPNVEELKNVYDKLKMKDITVKPITLLVSLFITENELMKFCERIKPSTADRETGLFIMNHRNKQNLSPKNTSYYKSLLLKGKLNFSLLSSCVLELVKYEGKTELIEELKQWKAPTFPVNGHMLMEKGVPEKKVGVVKKMLIDIWIENNFNISAESLLEQIPINLLSASSEKRPRKE